MRKEILAGLLAARSCPTGFVHRFQKLGTLRSGGIALTFEASDGTIRTIDTGNCKLLGTATRSQYP